jgi:8-oxo-dGTP diphosphatase
VAVLLIRHGHAGNRKEWQGEDRLRPLTPKGNRQALALPRRLERWPPARILSSPYLRCVQTVQPLADEFGLKVEEVEELAEGAGPAAVQLLRRFRGRSVALCTHGDIIPEVLIALADKDRIDLGPDPRQPKGSAWVLHVEHGRFVQATYVRPGR